MNNIFEILAPDHINFSETVVFCLSWLPRSGKSQGKTKIFQGREKSGNSLKSRGKSLVLSKSVKG